MRILIAGSRGYPKLDNVRRYVSMLPQGTMIIHGCARGVDTAAGDEALKWGLGVEEHPADWETYGKSAGFRRNAEMVERADLVVAFWDGRSHGTMNTISTARNRGKPFVVVFP